MTLVLVMQFIPVLLKEINRIRTAQMIRGSKMSRGIFKGLQTVISIMIPLVISTIRRAEQVAIAMESRRYGMYDNTTSYYKSEINLPDVVVIVLSVVLLILPAVLSKLLIK
jgi:energy-coupling factor transport system permease protein